MEFQHETCSIALYIVQLLRGSDLAFMNFLPFSLEESFSFFLFFPPPYELKGLVNVKLMGLALAPLAMLRREEAGRVVLQPGHLLRLPQLDVHLLLNLGQQLQLRLEERLHTFRFDLYGIRNVLILGAQRKNLIKISNALFC